MYLTSIRCRGLVIVNEAEENRRLTVVFGRKKNRRDIFFVPFRFARHECEASNGAIKVFRSIAELSSRAVIKEESPFVGFEAAAGLRSPGYIFSIRRIERSRIAPGTGGNFLGVRAGLAVAAGHRHDENFIVRASGFDF